HSQVLVLKRVVEAWSSRSKWGAGDAVDDLGDEVLLQFLPVVVDGGLLVEEKRLGLLDLALDADLFGDSVDFLSPRPFLDLHLWRRVGGRGGRWRRGRGGGRRRARGGGRCGRPLRADDSGRQHQRQRQTGHEAHLGSSHRQFPYFAGGAAWTGGAAGAGAGAGGAAPAGTGTPGGAGAAPGAGCPVSPAAFWASTAAFWAARAASRSWFFFRRSSRFSSFLMWS